MVFMPNITTNHAITYTNLTKDTLSAYHSYVKPGNSGENLNGTFHPGGNFPEKRNTFRGITFVPFLPKRPKFSAPFVWITSARLHVERKRKMYRYFVNGTTQSCSCFRCPKKYQYHLSEIFHPNFRTDGKRSLYAFMTVRLIIKVTLFIIIILVNKQL